MTKIVMTLLVRNEADILKDNIEFHLAAGVDHFIITDNGSEDATPSIAQRYVAQGLADLWLEPEDTYDQARWVTRMAHSAYTRHAADWIINNDADEFWVAAGGSLHNSLRSAPADCDAIYVERHNFPPTRGMGDDYLQSMVFRETQSLNALGAPLPGKLMHRGRADVCVGMGNHDAFVDGEPLRRSPTSCIEIHHFPIRTYSGFERKIVKGGEALKRNPSLPEGMGATWRRLYEIWRVGALPDWYRTQQLTDDQIRDALASGDLTVATTVRDQLGSK